MKRKIILADFPWSVIPIEEQLSTFKDEGFEGFFTLYNEEIADVKKLKNLTKEFGLPMHSVHAPFLKAAGMWEGGDAGKSAVNELIGALNAADELNSGVLVVHPFIGFDKNSPNQTGIDNFGKVVKRAGELGIKIAFENVEGENYLRALFDAFGDQKQVGFCWDSGHEQCYYKGKDLLKEYGKKLCYTHINDNLGVLSSDGSIFWHDDLHLLPFDGIIDWADVAKRLKRENYQGDLTLELCIQSKPNRNDNDKYQKMPFKNYVRSAYERALRIKNMLEN